MIGSRQDDDEGAVLILVLAFLGTVGIVILALLTQVGVGVKSTSVISDFGKKTYSADSGLDVALEAIQTDATLCPETSTIASGITSGLVVDAGIDPVTVTCKTTSGSAGGFGGYSVVTTDATSATSLATQNSGSKKVRGSVFVAGRSNLMKLVEVDNGNFIQATAPCPTAGTGVAVAAPYRLICEPRPTPTASVVAPAAPAAVNPAPNTTTVPGCSIFSPGRYTNKPVLSTSRNYFRSGVYSFEFAGPWNIDATSVVGGTAGSETTNLDAPCLLEGSPNGDGVTWVFRGTATLTVSNSARVELFSRRPLTPDGTPKVSIFVQGTRVGASIAQVTGTEKLVFHGLVYSPQAGVVTNAVGTVSFYALNGVVASTLLLQSIGDGLLVNTSEGLTTRTFVLEATAVRGGERNVVARAVGSVQPDGTLLVQSRWSR